MAFRICDFCGEWFDAYGRQKGCSDDCMKELKAIRRKKEHARIKADPEKWQAKLAAKRKEKILDCVICGSSFHKLGVSKTCSDECSKKLKEATRNQWKKENPEKVSDMKKSYYAKNKDKIKARNHYKPVAKVERTCNYCGSSFMGLMSMRYCNAICKEESEKKRRAESAAFRRLRKPKYWDEYYRKNKEAVDKQKKEYRMRRPEQKVRNMLREQLGTEPPPDLVEEATALRLLKRALRE